MARTLGALLHAARAAGLARLDAQLLAAHVLGRTRSWLIAHEDEPVGHDRAAALEALVSQRAQGVPLAYLVGEREFHGMTLRVTPAVLVPRPDTETLVNWALELLDPEVPAAVADLGTGSGAIALALARARPLARVVATDASAAALEVALDNAGRLGLAVEGRLGHWLEALDGRGMDLIVSNPPYIDAGDPHLPALHAEPLQALSPGPDGLSALREIIGASPGHLRAGGWLLLEHGWNQAGAVADLLREAGFQAVATRADLAGQPRCTGGRAPG